MTKPHAIFFDIDGTLISFSTHTIPVSAREAISRLREKGVKVIIATGRAFRDIGDLGGLEFDGYITSNGSCCMDAKGNVIARHVLSKESLERLTVHLKERPFPCEFMTDAGNFINYVDDTTVSISRLVNIPIPPVKAVSEIVKAGVFQLSAFVDPKREQELVKSVLTDCESSRWHPAFADFNIRGINKATGMDLFAAYFGIGSGSTMAFGDGGNDIAMLEHATVGVAMGNATDQVKAKANYVTDSVDEDGVVKALQYFELL